MNELEKTVKSAFDEKLEALAKGIENYKKIIKEAQQSIKQMEAEKKELTAKKSQAIKDLKNSDPKINCFKLDVSDSIQLSSDVVQKANEWIKLHEIKYHAAVALDLKIPKSQGAIGISKYFIKKGWTSIGDFVELCCETCRARFEHSTFPIPSKDYRFSLIDNL